MYPSAFLKFGAQLKCVNLWRGTVIERYGFKVHSYGYLFETLLVISKNLSSGIICLPQTIFSEYSQNGSLTKTDTVVRQCSPTQQQQVPEHVRKQ